MSQQVRPLRSIILLFMLYCYVSNRLKEILLFVYEFSLYMVVYGNCVNIYTERSCSFMDLYIFYLTVSSLDSDSVRLFVKAFALR